MKRYKVKIYAKWFDCPTSLATENVISYVCVSAKNTSEIENKINRRFNGRMEIIDIKEIK